MEERLTIDARLAARLHLAHHLPRRRLPGEKRPPQIDAQHAVERVRCEIEEIGAVEDGGVVDKYVDRTAKLQRGRDQGGDVRFVPDVAAHEAGAPSNLRQLGRGCLARRLVDVGDDGMSTGFGEFHGDGAPDTIAGAGHDDGFSREGHRCVSPGSFIRS